MPNVGRSSTGCALCRKRKIKCDEARPGCRRCAQARKVCPGYPFQIELNLRPLPTSTPAAEVQVQQDSLQPNVTQFAPPSLTSVSYSSSSISTQYSSTEGSPFKDEASNVKREGSTSSLYAAPDHPHSPPKYNVEHQSICYFVNLFCYQGSKRYDFPVLDFLPAMIGDARSDSAASKAALAVSRMALADQYSGTDVRLQTGHEYGEALILASRRLRDPSKACDDDTFLAVWLLSTYEAVQSILSHRRIGQKRTLEEEWQSHISHVRGAMQLIKMRGPSQLKTPQGEKMFRIFKAAIQLRLFILNSVTSREFDEMEMDIWKEEHEFTPSKTANVATAFFHKVARLIEKINAFLFARRQSDDDETFIQTANQFIAYGEAIDKEMEGWSTHEAYWDTMPIQSPAKGTTWAIYPSLAQCWFFSPWVYLYWIRFHIARVKLYEALIELLRTNASSPVASEADRLADGLQVASYQLHIQSAASSLIGMTAYAIGDVSNRGTFHSATSGKYPGKAFQEINVVAALQLVIPLKACLRNEHTSNDQKGAIDLAITHIGDGMRRQPVNVA